jgi:hypothetical protein
MPLAKTNHQSQPGHQFEVPLAEANHQTQPDHPSRMPLAEANYQSQPGHPSRMTLAKDNHQTQPNHHSWMPLVEANQQLNQHFIVCSTFVNNPISSITQLTFCSRFNIHQQPNFINDSISISWSV